MGPGLLSSFEARKGAHLRMTAEDIREALVRSGIIIPYTPKYACLMLSVDSISADVPDARMVPASSK